MPETDANVRDSDDTHSKTADNSSDSIHEECKGLKIAEKGAEDEDPDRHLAKIAIQRVSFDALFRRIISIIFQRSFL